MLDSSDRDYDAILEAIYPYALSEALYRHWMLEELRLIGWK